MLQEIIEGKWVDAFERVLALNGIQGGTPVVIVAETQSRPVHMQLAALACHNLGASYSTVVLPTPPQSAPVPVKSTGACNAIQHKRHVIEGLKAAEVIVDVTVEGLIHAEEIPEILASGTRLYTVCNEHPEILERTEPKAEMAEKVALGIEMLNTAEEMRVCSAAGTDLTIDIRDAPCGGTRVYDSAGNYRPLAWWPLLSRPRHRQRDLIVMDVGDMNLTFKSYIRDPVTLTVRNDFVTEIDGTGLDVDLFRSYVEAWDDPLAYGFSHT